MAWILDQFHKVQGHLQCAVASSDPVDPPPWNRARIVESSSQVPPPFPPEEERLLASSSGTNPIVQPRPRQINDNVHEVHKPAGRPSVEVVFYHGLQLVGPDEAHLTTWLSGKGTELWLNWLPKDFQDARILTISYDAHAEKTDEQGRMDMYVTCENLVASLLDAQIGQDGCPVVFVGHCIGGLIMKELCVRANSNVALNAPDKHRSPLENLLHNVRGFFSYASPHHGSTLADSSTWFSKGPLFEGITTRNTEAARRNEEFRKLRTKYKWKAAGVVEAWPITLGRFKGLVVEEASAREDVDTFYTVAADHFHVCRPESPKSSSFSLLGNFIDDILKEDKALRHGHKVELSGEVVGLDDQMKKILEMHKDTRRLGIVGMGGIGKTTLAKSLYNTISGSYEYTCFLLEVKKTILADDQSPDKLRKLIIGSLFHQGRKVHSSFDWDTLKGKTALIVLDDAESESQVLGVSDSDGFAEKSLVIVTSRNRGFLVPEKFECHFAVKLGYMDSRTIFCVHAFNQTNAPAGYEEQVDRFTRKCDGLPLALKVAGKYLYKRDKSLWDEAFVKLSRAQSLNGDLKDRLFSILRVCVYSLDEAEREMFLDVAVCFHGEELAAVKRAWSVCYPANSGWENLVDRGLVSTERDSRPVIQMHEVLRHLGRRIAYEDSQNIAGHSRVLRLSRTEVRCGEFLHVSIPRPWHEVLHDPDPKDLDYKLLSHEGISKAKVLKIENGDGSVMDVNLLGELHELRTLWVDVRYPVRFPGQFHKLPSRLLYLRVTGVRDWTEVSEETSPSREDLQLHGTLLQFEIVDCWTLKTLPMSLRQLSALTHLRIVGCNGLETLPGNLGSLQALENFHIEGCHNLKSLPNSIGTLRALKSLHIEACLDLETLPSSFVHLQVLEFLHIHRCPSCLIFPRSFSELRSLNSLFIDYRCQFFYSKSPSVMQAGTLSRPTITLTYLVTVLEQLENLKDLYTEQSQDVEGLQITLGQFQDVKVFKIEGLQDVRIPPNSLGLLRALEYLEIASCDSLETLPNSLGQLQGLEELNIRRCDKLTTLPDTIGQMRNLRRLEILSCKRLKFIPETLGELQALEVLEIGGCEKLTSLPDTTGQLRNLRCLEIWSCKRLEFLPHTLGELQALEELKIEWCGYLKTLPDTTGQLRNLRRLEILSCKRLKLIPETLGELQALEELKIGWCGNLKSRPGTTGQLRNLRRLEIFSSYRVEFLPNTLGELQALEELKIGWCGNLKTRPDTIGQLRNLKRLEILGCKTLESLPNTLGKLQALEELKIELCGSLKTLPDTTGQLRNLRRLEILSCNSLEFLPNTLGRLQALEELKIRRCGNLKTLPDTTGQLLNLRRLEVLYCKRLEFLPNTLGKLQALEELKIERCGNLKSLPDTTGQLRNLRRLEVLYCWGLETLPNTMGQLQALAELKIRECVKLKTLPQTTGQLRNLRRLEILCCKRLELLPETLGELQALEELKIVRCGNLTTLPDTTGQLRNFRMERR